MEPNVSIHRRSDAGRLRLALVHDGGQDLAALASILCHEGVAPETGVLPLSRAHELAGDPPDAIVVAFDLGQPGAVAAVRRLRRDAPEAPIVVVGCDASGRAARDALNAGAQAFVSEGDAAMTLAPAIRAAVAGLVCAPRAARRMVARPAFSHREREVLSLVASGMTNRQIAARLWLAESTVKSHVASAFSKLGVRSRKDAAAIVLDPEGGLMPTSLAPDLPSRSGAEDGRSTRSADRSPV